MNLGTQKSNRTIYQFKCNKHIHMQCIQFNNYMNNLNT